MGFELEAGEEAPSAIRRIVRERADQALRCLTATKRRREAKRIHTARKRFKEIRAALRLARSGLGKKLFRKENAAYRDAARPLSAVRDASTLVDALDALAEHFRDDLSKRAFDSTRRALRARARRVRRRVLVEGGALRKVRDSVRRSRRRIDRWRLEPFDHAVFLDGFADTYRSGRRAMACARRGGSDEDLHEWRKQVKYLRHQAEILRPVFPEMMEVTAGQARELASHLGDDHDLAVMREIVTDELRDTIDRRECHALLGLISDRRATLQKQSRRLGKKLYAKRAKAFAKRVEKYLRQWA